MPIPPGMAAAAARAASGKTSAAAGLWRGLSRSVGVGYEGVGNRIMTWASPAGKPRRDNLHDAGRFLHRVGKTMQDPNGSNWTKAAGILGAAYAADQLIPGVNVWHPLPNINRLW